MVISLSVRPAFEQLRDQGAVVSFRGSERELTPREGHQETWCNRGRNLSKEFDVTVTHLAEKEPGDGTDQFGIYLPLSGFEDTGSWLKAVLRLHDEVPPRGHFYLITREGFTPERLQG